MKNQDEIHHPVELKEIYSSLEIHPNLQEHMVWVAGLAKVIADNWKGEPLDSEALTQACLFHDSAKLIKFKAFNEDSEHWEQVKQRYIEKYGDVEHEATIAMCREAGVSEGAIKLLNDKNINPFIERARFIAQSSDFALKILAYCDSRISPTGLTTLQGRYEELLTRDTSKVEDKESMKLFLEIEKQIQKYSNIDLKYITQEQVDQHRNSLLNYKI